MLLWCTIANIITTKDNLIKFLATKNARCLLYVDTPFFTYLWPNKRSPKVVAALGIFLKWSLRNLNYTKSNKTGNFNISTSHKNAKHKAL